MLTTETIEKFLTDHYQGAAQKLSALNSGAWSAAYTFLREGKWYVIRFSTVVENFHQDRVAGRFASETMPIPAILEIGKVEDYYFAVSERVNGTHIDNLDAEGWQGIKPTLFGLFDDLRRADVSQSSGYGRWNEQGEGQSSSWKQFLLSVSDDKPGRLIHGWRANLEKSDYGTADFEEILAHYLELLKFCPERRHLIHSDLLNFNLLINDDRISGVVDWGSAMYGDFLYDIAWYDFYQPWYSAMSGIDFAGDAYKYFTAKGLELPNYTERILCYKLHIALDSIAYNSFKENWSNAKDAANAAFRLLQ